jgi:hypothetical protein
MSSRSVHCKLHQTINPIQEKECLTLIKHLSYMPSRREGALHCDETTWPIYPTGMKT